MHKNVGARYTWQNTVFEEIVTENLPKLVKGKDIHTQEAQRVPNKMNPKRSTPRHIIIKMSKVKDKERILKAARQKKLVTYKGVPIRLLADFPKETFSLKGIGKKYSKS